MKSVILMGIKHCGKSTQGRLLSQRLSLPFFDTDDVVLEITKMTPREIYTTRGEDAFKAAECSACEKIASGASAASEGVIVATGGGICQNPAALETLRRVGFFFFLKTDENIAASRVLREIVVGKDGTLSNMPAYIAKKNPRTKKEAGEIFHEFFEGREKIYASLADAVIEMGDGTKQENLQKLLSAIDEMRRA